MRCFIWKLELVSDILWVIVASRAFPKATIFVVCTEFAVGLKFHFSQWKINFSQFIFIDKYLKSKEIEYFIHDIKSERWLVLFYVHSYFLLTVELLGLLQFFPNLEREHWKFAFVNVAAVGLPNFFQFMK